MNACQEETIPLITVIMVEAYSAYLYNIIKLKCVGDNDCFVRHWHASYTKKGRSICFFLKNCQEYFVEINWGVSAYLL